MIFNDRIEAGELLAKKLSRLKFAREQSIIVAIPRGGVLVAAAISQKLGIRIVPLVIKKLSAPFNSELAIGATASFGKPVLDSWMIADLSVSADYLKGEILKKKREAKKREKFLGIAIDPENYTGKMLIVVDDGLATGQTVKAAAKIIRTFRPKKMILAVPCASPQALELVRGEFDNVICLETRADFMAVGQFYRDFRPVEDSEVKLILAKVSKKVSSGAKNTES